MRWNDWIGLSADVVGILGIPVIGLLIGRKMRFQIKLWLYRRRYGATGSNGYIVMFGNNRMKKSVADYCETNTELASICEAARVHVPTEDRIKPDNVDQLLEAFEEKRLLARQVANADTMHLFIDSNLAMASLIGGKMYNVGIVYLYHYENGSYINYGPLNRRELGE
jgi:hypothetical protein